MKITDDSTRTSRASSQNPTVLTARKGAAGRTAAGQPKLLNRPEVYSRPCTRSQAERFSSQVRYQEQLAKRSVSVQRPRCQARSMLRALKNVGARGQKRTMVSGVFQKKIAAARLVQTLRGRAKSTGSSKHPSKASSKKPTVLSSGKGAADKAVARQPKLVNLQEVNSRPYTRSQAERFSSLARYQEQLTKRQRCQARSMLRDLKNVGAGGQKRTIVSGAFQEKFADARLDQTLRGRAKFTGSSKHPSKASSKKPTVLSTRRGAAGKAAAGQPKLANLQEVYSRPCTRSQAERFSSRVRYQEQLAKRHASTQHQRCQARSMLSDLKDEGGGVQKRTMIFSAFRSKAEVGRLGPELHGRARNINDQSKHPSRASRKPSTSSTRRGAASKSAARYPLRANLQGVRSAPCTRSQTKCFATQVTCQEQLDKRSVSAQQQRCIDRSTLKSSNDVGAERHKRRVVFGTLETKGEYSDPTFGGRATKIAYCSKKPPKIPLKKPTVVSNRNSAAGETAASYLKPVNRQGVDTPPYTRSQTGAFSSRVKYNGQLAKHRVFVKRRASTKRHLSKYLYILNRMKKLRLCDSGEGDKKRMKRVEDKNKVMKRAFPLPKPMKAAVTNGVNSV